MVFFHGGGLHFLNRYATLLQWGRIFNKSGEKGGFMENFEVDYIIVKLKKKAPSNKEEDS